MQFKIKKKKNRYGASSVFLGIILSAVILIECTFVAFVWELDYNIKVNNAVDAQVESIMCEYNRQLFDVYGIYAFTMNAVDDDIYRKALLACGYTEGPELNLAGYKKIDSKALRDAINIYYSYRGSGIAIIRIADVVSAVIEEFLKTDVLKSIREFSSSPAAGYVTDIIQGTEKISGWLEKAGKVLNKDKYESAMKILDQLKGKLSGKDNDLEDLSFNIKISDMKPAIKLIEGLSEFHESLGKSDFKPLTHILEADYFAYNFDCYLKQDIDASINGTDFSSIHENNNSDSEFILTGQTGNTALATVNLRLLQVLTGSNFLKDYLDKDFRSKVDIVSAVISAIIAAVTEGAVEIDYKIITVALLFRIATYQAAKDIKTLRKGERVTIFKVKDKDLITAGYRDFLFLFMQTVPDEKLESRALIILKRDYGDLYTGITGTADTGLKKITVSRSYALYG